MIFNKNCLNLLRSIIIQALNDLLSSKQNKRLKTPKEKAEKFLDIKNKSFRAICIFADLEPSSIIEVKNKRLKAFKNPKNGVKKLSLLNSKWKSSKNNIPKI